MITETLTTYKIQIKFKYDIRYNGRKRLQRMYFVAASNGTLPEEIDYPDLITFSN